MVCRGRPITLVGLNIALQQGDADFARKVAKVQPNVYQDFKRAYLDNRWDSTTCPRICMDGCFSVVL